MTEPIEIVRLREQIAYKLYCFALNLREDDALFKLVANKEKLLELTAQILALTKPDGTKAIGVIADEQELPDVGCENVDGYCEGNGNCYDECHLTTARAKRLAQYDMLNAGYRGLVK